MDTNEIEVKLVSTHRVQTSANAVRYPSPTRPKHVINSHPQLLQFLFKNAGKVEKKLILDLDV